MSTFDDAIRKRPRRTAATFASTALAALMTIAWLAIGPAAAQAGTWNIYPTITNLTGSTADTCTPGSGNVGCIVLESSGVVTGNWTSSPAGGIGKISTRPGENTDTPAFDAPNFAEGADGYFAYAMPDGSEFSLAAKDDQGVIDAFNQAYPGCGVKPGQGPSPDGFSCLASYPSGTNGSPSSGSFKPQFTFYSNAGQAPPYTAAGQVCSTTDGGVMCTAGLGCGAFVNNHLGCFNKAPIAGGGQLSPTDPNNWMWLNFVNLGDSPVTMTNFAVIDGSNPPSYFSECSMPAKGNSCSLLTSGGCAVSKANCGSDAIKLTPDGGSTAGSVMVMQQAEIPSSMAENWEGAFVTAIENAIWTAFNEGAPGGLVVKAKPRISNLRATSAPAGKAKKTAAKKTATKSNAQTVRVAFRSDRPTHAVLALERSVAGVRRGGTCVAPSRTRSRQKVRSCQRWVALPGAKVRASTRALWNPKSGTACPASAKRGPKGGVRCQRRITLKGHARHQAIAGDNRVTLPKVNGKSLTPGRYRVTVTGLSGVAQSRSASTTFRIGSGR